MGFYKAGKRLHSKYERFARLYAKMLMNGKVDYNQLIKVYNRSEQMPEVKSRKLLRLNEVQDVVTDEILKIYESNGITADFVLKKRLEVLNEALSNDKKDLTNANKVLESFESKLIDNVKQQETREIQQISFVDMLPDGNKAKLTAKKTIKSLTAAKQQINEAIIGDISQDNQVSNDNV